MYSIVSHIDMPLLSFICLVYYPCRALCPSWRVASCRTWSPVSFRTWYQPRTRRIASGVLSRFAPGSCPVWCLAGVQCGLQRVIQCGVLQVGLALSGDGVQRMYRCIARER